VKSARRMTAPELVRELDRVGKEWDEFRRDLEGMSGSPGEWLVERMDEIKTELKRRSALTATEGGAP
jgi:hypothetical protein